MSAGIGPGPVDLAETRRAMLKVAELADVPGAGPRALIEALAFGVLNVLDVLEDLRADVARDLARGGAS